MKVLRSSAPLLGPVPRSGPSVVTIGNFDGCHRGHQELIKKTLLLAQQLQAESVVLTFDPNPKQFFQPQRQVGKLFQPSQKIRALRELGVSALWIQSFDKAFSQLSPREFYEELLYQCLHARAIVVGQDFRFGAQRLGSVEMLRELAAEYGATVHVVAQQEFDEQPISSSRVRQLLQERDIERVRSLLNRPYLLEGRVVEGKKLGRALGFPTANLDWGDQMLPGLGVYAGFAVVGREAPIFHLDPAAVPCILNIGLRPTVDQSSVQPSVEVHLLEGQYAPDSLYGQKLSVSLCHFLRGEKKFASLEVLRQQIGHDCEQARSFLKTFNRSECAGL